MKTLFNMCLLSLLTLSSTAMAARPSTLIDVILDPAQYGELLQGKEDGESDAYLLKGKAGLMPCAIMIETNGTYFAINSFEALYLFETRINAESMGRYPLTINSLKTHMNEERTTLGLSAEVGDKIFVNTSLKLKGNILTIDQDISDIKGKFGKSVDTCEVDLRKSK